jgi:hypothetical protein
MSLNCGENESLGLVLQDGWWITHCHTNAWASIIQSTRDYIEEVEKKKELNHR